MVILLTLASLGLGIISAIAAAVFLRDRFPKLQQHLINWTSRIIIAIAVCVATVMTIGYVVSATRPIWDNSVRPVGIREDLTPQAKATAIPESTPLPTPSTVPEATIVITYVVQPGDSLSDIADKFDAKIEDIMKINRPPSHTLFVGQKVQIPIRYNQFPESRSPPRIPATALVEADGGLNVRDAPSTSGVVVWVAADGETLNLTGTRRIVNGIEWLRLDYDDEYWWVQARYLKIVITATVILIDGMNVYSNIERAEVAYRAPYGSFLELRRPSPVVDVNAWWQVTDGNWVRGRYLDFGV